MNEQDNNPSQSYDHAVDFICDEFESEWKLGKTPEIYDFIERVAETARPQLFQQLLEIELWWRREDTGETKQDEYYEKYPQFATEITFVFNYIADTPAENIVDEATHIPSLNPGQDSSTKNVKKHKDETEKISQPKFFGDYEIINEIARGGMGVVLEARQVSLNRFVAIKMILPSCLPGPEEIHRFHREAEAVAKLSHPNIIPIYEFGEHDEQHFYCMRLVKGGSLSELIGASSVNQRQAAEMVRRIAEAIHYAHTRNIVHRDLKPANILLDEYQQPHVADFGLAKHIDDDNGHTATGAIMGTPSYMAPEQAEGRLDKIGPLVDVYALGGILFYLLTGHPPFKGSNAVEIIRRVVETEPVSPRQYDSNIDADLATICVKCLQKDPGRRYGSARELADELLRWLERRPILARPVNAIERTVLWCRRKPVLATLSALLLFSLISGFLVSSHFYLEADERANKLVIINHDLLNTQEALRNTIEDRDDVIRLEKQLRYNANMRQLQSAYEANNARLVRELLDGHIPQGNEEDMRDFEWYYWNRKVKKTLVSQDYKNGACGISCAPHANAIYIEDPFSNNIVKMDLLSGNKLLAIEQKNWVLSSFDINPNGAEFLTSYGDSNDKTIRVWDAIKGKLLLKIEHSSPVLSACFSPEGNKLLTGSRNAAHLWDRATGVVLDTFPTTSYVTAVDYHPDGSHVLFATKEGIISLIDSSTDIEKYHIRAYEPDPTREYENRVRDVCFSPDGMKFVSISDDSIARVWDSAKGKQLFSLEGHASQINTVAFNNESTLIATGGKDRFVKLWDAHDGSEIRTIRGHEDSVECVAFTPDGTYLVTAGYGDPPRLWPVESDDIVRSRHGHRSAVTSIVVSSDGNLILTGGEDSSAKIWDSRNGKLLYSLEGHLAGVTSVDFNHDASLAITGSKDRTAKIWNVQTGTEIRSLQQRPESRILNSDGHLKGIRSVSFSPNGDQVLTNLVIENPSTSGRGSGQWYSEVAVWDTQSGTISSQRQYKSHNWEWPTGFTPNGLPVILIHGGTRATTSSPLSLWNVNTEERVLDFKEPYKYRAPMHLFTFSSTGSRLLTANYFRDAMLWDATTGTFLFSLKTHPDAINAVAVNHSDNRLLTGCQDGSVRLWDASTGELLLLLEEGQKPITSVCFSPSGNAIYAGCEDGRWYLWSTESITEWAVDDSAAGNASAVIP